jgi:hypothetical protein
VRKRIELAADEANDVWMRPLFRFVLSALLITILTACGSVRPGAAPGVAFDPPRRCAHCGWIESKREIQPGVAERHGVRVYEYTVRMADGSSSVFQEKLPSSWRLGERLIVLAGAGR